MDAIGFARSAKGNKVDVVDNAKKALSEAKRIDSEYDYMLEIDTSLPEKAKKAKKGRLFGVPITIKDCICVKDMQTRAGSKILEGYNPVFDATAVTRIKEEGGLILGKTAQDVFGFGSFNTNVGTGYKTPKNPFDKSRATGGSSGGSAGMTQKMQTPHIAVAESTGGSIAAPACYCGVYGLTPTYGRVSRYGLLDYANSMDKIGVMSKSIEDAALMLEIISGHDDMDPTSSREKVPAFTKQVHTSFKAAILEEFFNKDVSKEVKENVFSMLHRIKYSRENIPLTFRYGIETYYVISMSEASTNLSKYCGIRYGRQEKLEGDFNTYFSKVRSKYFSKEAKRRVILGTFARMSGFRDAYYMKALKVRTKIIGEYKKLFRKYDLMITPSMPDIAPRFSEIGKMTPLENFMTDLMTVGPNLAGFPHLTIPAGFKEGMPTGMLVIADHFQEQKLIDFARTLSSSNKKRGLSENGK